jgi:hypothetical protein
VLRDRPAGFQAHRGWENLDQKWGLPIGVFGGANGSEVSGARQRLEW